MTWLKKKADENLQEVLLEDKTLKEPSGKRRVRSLVCNLWGMSPVPVFTILILPPGEVATTFTRWMITISVSQRGIMEELPDLKSSRKIFDNKEEAQNVYDSIDSFEKAEAYYVEWGGTTFEGEVIKETSLKNWLKRATTGDIVEDIVTGVFDIYEIEKEEMEKEGLSYYVAHIISSTITGYREILFNEVARRLKARGIKKIDNFSEELFED